MHIEFRRGIKDFLLFESLDFRKRVTYGLEKKLRRPENPITSPDLLDYYRTKR
jgi:hypothetical protein